jgi:hypothetical protein
MKLEVSPLSLTLGLCAGIGFSLFVQNLISKDTMTMNPAPDSKVEQNYRRNGFGDKIMSSERRRLFSNCYKTMLRANGYDEARPTPKPGQATETGDHFEGKMTFVFHVAEDGKLNSFEVAETDFKDRQFVKCVSDSLVDLRFLPPPLGINRYLAHEFVFKSDDTFKREMEERKNQSPLTLVTATPAAGSAAAPESATSTNSDDGMVKK